MQHAVGAFALARVDDVDALAARPREHPGVAHLPASLRIEDCPVELDAALVDRDDARARLPQICVFPEQ